MSDSSPRWPSASGASGLDFSPRPPEGRAGDGAPRAASSNGYAAPRDAPNGSAQQPSSFPPPAKPESVPTPVKAEESASEETRTVPAVAGRAAKAAQDWAAKARTAVTSRTGGGASPAAAPLAGEPAVGEPTVAFAVAPDITRTQAPTPSAGNQPAPSSAGKRSIRRTRKARLRLSRLDPWSVMKTSFLFSIAFGVMMVVATFMVWSVLSGSGALESVNQLINTLIGDANTVFDIGEFLSMSRVLGFATVVAAIDVVILTAVATLFAFLYNLAATVMGGLEVTLAED